METNRFDSASKNPICLSKHKKQSAVQLFSTLMGKEKVDTLIIYNCSILKNMRPK